MPVSMAHQTRLSGTSTILQTPARLSANCTPLAALRMPVDKIYSIRRSGRALNRRAARLCVQAALVEKLNASELQVAINERDRPLVIDFYATWCGPCLLLAKELEQVAEDLGDRVRIVKVDTDENQELSNQLRIEGLPTMVFVGTDPSKPAIRTEGLLPAGTIKDIIRDELSSAPAVS